ncbi:HAD family hydrolase [Candidatus Uhrbacteria bacterium]|nr:HAD family hydrolase [Candidatus Uhrbacteria bacterium]
MRVLVFDFDGVIADSNHVKQNSWFKIFEKDPLKVQEALKASLAVMREAPRRQILADIARRLELNARATEEFVNAYADAYQKAVEQGVVAGYYPQTDAALQDLRKSLALYVSSATPQDGMDKTIDALGIRGYFAAVFGSPPDKTTTLRKIIADARLVPADVVCIGDGESDRKAAADVGCRFLGIANEFNRWSPMSGIELVESVAALPAYLLTHKEGS